jgi:hypothetical protein
LSVFGWLGVVARLPMRDNSDFSDFRGDSHYCRPYVCLTLCLNHRHYGSLGLTKFDVKNVYVDLK